jgi:putative ABC transport system permease protein
MDSYVDEWLSQRRFNTLLLGIFAGLALVLAMMGIYGVLSNLVASRVREIGIRMAIGARPGAIGWLVLRQSMIPVAIGLCVGLAGSLALSRFLEALLFQVHPRDPLTLGAAAATILLLSPAAIYAPLRRATRVDCTVALREE